MADFDFSTIIYIVVMILFAILGGRKRKKPQQSPSVQKEYQAPPETDTGFDLFEKYFREDPFSVEKPVEKSTDDFMEFEEPEHPEMEEADFVETIRQDIGDPLHSQHNKVMEEEHDKIEVIDLDREIDSPVSDFDIRKAVIYSEILKRKTF